MDFHLKAEADRIAGELRKVRLAVSSLEGHSHLEIETAVRLARDIATAAAEQKYGPDLERLRAKREELQAAHDAAQVALGQAATAGLHTGILFEWKRKYERFSSKEGPPQATGRRGVVEVWAKGSQARGSYGLPAIGEVVLRVLKKDGTPSVDFERHPKDLIGKLWFPEGVKPEGAAP